MFGTVVMRAARAAAPHARRRIAVYVSPKQKKIAARRQAIAAKRRAEREAERRRKIARVDALIYAVGAGLTFAVCGLCCSSAP